MVVDNAAASCMHLACILHAQLSTTVDHAAASCMFWLVMGANAYGDSVALVLHSAQAAYGRHEELTLLVFVGVLYRAEWLKFVGLFFNLDDSANTLFNEINSSYYTKSASYTASNAGKGNHTVAWINLFHTGFQVSFVEYKMQFVTDAGGNVINETALGAMSNVTAWEHNNSTLQFAWGPTDGGFANQTAAIAAFHRFLSNVGSDLSFCCHNNACSCTVCTAGFALSCLASCIYLQLGVAVTQM